MNFDTLSKYLCWSDRSLGQGVTRAIAFGGIAAAILLLLSSLVFALIGPANVGSLAAAPVFKIGWFFTILAAVIWAPLWETLIGQIIPISLLTSLNARPSIAIVSSATLFSAGHIAYGGGIGQGMVTFAAGLLFASLFAANARPGIGRASLFTGAAHATNNALLILLSYGFGV